MRSVKCALSLLLLALLPVGEASGGVIVTGVGSGTGVAGDGSFTCRDATFTVQVVYLPDNHGILTFYWIGKVPDCLQDGMATGVGTLHYDLSTLPPTAQWEFTCSGTEATGLSCDYGGSDGFLRVGPYSGPGSTVWLVAYSDSQSFSGTFTAL